MTIENQIPFLYKIAYKYTNQSSVADDLVQETVYKALKNINKFRKGTNLRAWLSIILRNSFINSYRKKSKYSNTDNVLSYVGDNDDYKEYNYGESNMQVAVIKEAIAELPESLQYPFMLKFNGFSYKEIAAKIDIPLGTVKSRIHLARRKLKSKLGSLRAA